MSELRFSAVVLAAGGADKLLLRVGGDSTPAANPTVSTTSVLPSQWPIEWPA